MLSYQCAILAAPWTCYIILLHLTIVLPLIILWYTSSLYPSCCIVHHHVAAIYHHHAASMYHHHCFGAFLFDALLDWLGHSNSSPNSIQNVARIALHKCVFLSKREGKPWLQCSAVPTPIPSFGLLLSIVACYSKLSLSCGSPSRGYSFT